MTEVSRFLLDGFSPSRISKSGAFRPVVELPFK
jgi:hypothetical protein